MKPEANLSWKTEAIILNRLALKEEHDFESDAYNSLLIIEKKTRELYELGVLTTLEIQILNSFSNGAGASDISKGIPLHERTISVLFRRACEKISFCLGGEFTDYGTIDELSKKHELTGEQTEKLIAYMKVDRRHNLPKVKKDAIK